MSRSSPTLSIVYDSEVELPDRPATPASSVSVNSLATSCTEASGSESDSRAGPPSPERRCSWRAEFKQTRRRHHREPVDLSDVDLSHLWDPELRKDRDHLPPPELEYDTLDEAMDAVTTWGKDHGVKYSIQGWSRGGRYRRLMACSRHGKPKNTHKLGDKRKRPGASSDRIGCRMQFLIVAKDYTDLDNSVESFTLSRA